jgi:hypothetical protein
MSAKKKFLVKLYFMLTTIIICLLITPFTAGAAETKREYEVTGKIVSEYPIFNNETEVEISNGYYVIQPHSSWTYFGCESKDGSIKFQYYLEKNNIYEFIVTDKEETRTYCANDGGILDNNGKIQGTKFDAQGYKIDFSKLTFTEPKERFPQGVYKGTGANSLDADFVMVKVYDTVISMDFYKSDKLIKNIAGNYDRVNAAGTTTFTHDYKGFFTASLTVDGRLYGSRSFEGKEEKIEFDLQLEDANTIKNGSYLAKWNFPNEFDQVRMDFIDMDYSLELMNKDKVIKSYHSVNLKEIKPDGTLVLEAYDGSNLLARLEVSSDGSVRGMLYDGYNINLKLSLIKMDNN